MEQFSSQSSQRPNTVPLSVTPTWLFPSRSTDFYFLEKLKSKDCGNIVVLVEDILHSLYKIFIPVYTDGSNDPITGKKWFWFHYTRLKSFSEQEKLGSFVMAALQWVE